MIAAAPVELCTGCELVLDVRFASRAGERWQAVGVCCTVDDAIAFARQSLPDGTWIAVSWDDLYGD
jgi:hypothetical protein